MELHITDDWEAILCGFASVENGACVSQHLSEKLFSLFSEHVSARKAWSAESRLVFRIATISMDAAEGKSAER